MDAALFWQQTPRINHSVIDGVFARLKREHEQGVRASQRAGLFAQVLPKEHERLVKRMIAGKSDAPRMSGSEIGNAMRAWARRMG